MERSIINETIKKIELEFDVNSLNFEGICTWPLMRDLIINGLKLKIKATPDEVEYNIKRSIFYIKEYAEKSSNFIEQYGCQLTTPKTQSSAIFLTSEDYRENLRVDGKSFHKFYDSLRLQMPENHTLIGLEFPTSEKKNLSHNFSTTFSLRHLLEIVRMQNSMHILERHLKGLGEPIPETIKSFYLFLAKENIYVSKNATNFLRYVRFVLTLKDYFIRIIRQTNAKAWFLTCFYGDVAMAGVLAAKESRIPSVDFQHGQQGDDHPSYTNWNCVPDSGYQLLPDIFATWGQRSQERIANTFLGNPHHRAVLVGSPLMSVYLNQLVKFDKPELSKIEYLNPTKTRILVALQPVNLQWFLSQVKDLVQMLNDDVIWLVRNHPTHPGMKRYEETINHFMLELDDYHIELEHSTTAALPDVLKIADLTLTQFSTVAYEGLSMNVPSILMLEDKKEHSDMSGNGFYRVESALEASKIISDGKWRAGIRDNQYIVPFKKESLQEMLMTQV